jgi:serine/threonine protein kinase
MKPGEANGVEFTAGRSKPGSRVVSFPRGRSLTASTSWLRRPFRASGRSSDPADLTGRSLDRYQILELVGEGGMGSVYRAWDTRLKRFVAVKVLVDDAGNAEMRLARFSREIQMIAGLSHPSILEIHDYGTCRGISYAVMELLRGRNLRERLKGRPMTPNATIEIGIAVAEGLGAAHRRGVLHRDIKPENIFITSSGEVKILDFGLACSVEPAGTETDTESMPDMLTCPGTVLGTTGYMSPEQLRGDTLDPRCDIFSLGCVLYEMLSGSNPFRRATRVDTMAAVLSENARELGKIRADLPPVLDRIVERCLEKNLDRRFESARDIAFALRAIADSSTRPTKIKGPGRYHPRRWRDLISADTIRRFRSSMD